MKLSLVVLTTGKSEGKTIPITLSQFVIGRDPQCQLRPASVSISKRHCAILVRAGKVFVRDLDSTNGTFVNEEPVKGEVELRHDDKLKIGPLLFGVRIEATPAASKPTPPPATKTPAGAAAKPTPAPATTTPLPKKPEPEAADDESVAAWLLSLGDEESSTPSGEAEVPDGSTVVMDKETLEKQQQKAGAATADDKAARDKLAQAKALQADTADAAKQILQKYMRRPRGGGA